MSDVAKTNASSTTVTTKIGILVGSLVVAIALLSIVSFRGIHNLSSELSQVANVSSHKVDLAASLGNILGSCVNWYLGRFITRFQGRRWFPLTQTQVTRAEGWYRRYGRWSLLLSWAPIIGDPLTIVAGVLREPLPVFIALIVLAKTARYLAVTGLTLGWM